MHYYARCPLILQNHARTILSAHLENNAMGAPSGAEYRPPLLSHPFPYVPVVPVGISDPRINSI